jgi:hypothetical protein
MAWTCWVCSSVALLLACGPTVGDGGGEGGDATSSSASAGASVSDTNPDPSAGPSSGSDPTTSTTSTDDAASVDTGTPILDVGELPASCDLFADECPKGYKCMPWADDGSDTWSATKCSPIAPDPRAVGESCTVEGSGVSGVDDCEAHAMCFGVDPDTNMGECIAFCYGNSSNGVCTDPCSSCTVSATGPLALCLPTCNPIGPDGCDDGLVCLPLGDTFACGVHARGGGLGTLGAPCEFVNVCDAGLFCADATQLPSCDGPVGCCAAFCDLDAEDPCDALVPGTVCTPWYGDGEVPPDTCIGGAVGACLSP